LTNEQTVGIIVVIYCATNRLLGSQSVRAILIRNGSASFNRCRKLSAVPSKGIRASVVIAERIADAVIDISMKSIYTLSVVQTCTY